MLSTQDRSNAMPAEDPCAGMNAQELRNHARSIYHRLRSPQTPPIRRPAAPAAAAPVAAETTQPAQVVRGAPNARALAAIEMLAAGKIIGPLFIWGPRGYGKTTMALAAATSCPRAKIIDDADRRAEQVLTALSEPAPVILTGPLPPAQMEHGKLRELLTQALVVELSPFDRTFAKALAGNMIAAQRELTPSFAPPPAVLEALLEVPSLDGHLLAGLLKGLAFAAAQGEELTAAVLERVRGDLIDPTAHDSRITIRLIQRVVAAHFEIDLSDLVSQRRQKCIVVPRQIAMTLSKRLTERSMPEIGRLFRRDHTTVLHALRRIEALEGRGLDNRRLLSVLADRVRLQAYVEATSRNANRKA